VSARAARSVPGGDADPPLVRPLAVLCGVLLLLIVGTMLPLAYAAHELVDAVFPIAFASAFGLVGLIVALRQPRNAIGWTLLAIALLVGGSFVVETYAYLIYHLGDHGLPLGRLAVFLAPCWYPGVVLLPLPILLFPDGRLPSGRWRPIICLYVVAGAVALATAGWLDLAALLDRRLSVDASGQLATIDHPSGWESAALHASLVLFLVVCVLFVVRQVLAFRGSTGIHRQQLKTMLVGGGVCILGLLLTVTLGAIPGQIAYVLSNLAFLAINALPIGIGLGILRYRLYEIDRVISRTLAYALLSGTLVGVYLMTVTLATRALPLSSPIGVAAATLAAAALFTPLRRRIQHAVDRRFNRARFDADAIVASFTAQLRDAIDLESVQEELASAVVRTVEPQHVALWIRPPVSR